MVVWTFAPGAFHNRITYHEQHLLFERDGVRLVTLSDPKTAAVCLSLATECDSALGADFGRAYALDDRAKALLTAAEGAVRVRIRGNGGIVLKTTHDGLTTSVTDTTTAPTDTYRVEAPEALAFPLRLDHWRRFAGMLGDEAVRVDAEESRVTFTGDRCGACFDRAEGTTGAFTVAFADLEFVLDQWRAPQARMGAHSNGVVFVRDESTVAYISPIIP
jgi:hypothetical protein